MTEASSSFFDDTRRLAALHALALTGGGPSADFDAIVKLAATMLDCPVAMLNLIDRDRLLVKARHGIDLDTLPREHAFCDHTIRQGDTMVVDDLRRDPRFTENPFVIPEDGARFYAGITIHAVDPDGVRQPIGALCVMDRVPRSLVEGGRQTLHHLAGLAEALVAARKLAIEAIDLAAASEQLATDLARKERIFKQAERIARIGAWRMSIEDQAIEWSDGVARIHGLPAGTQVALSEALDYYPPGERATVTASLATAMETGEPFDFEADLDTAQRARRRVRAIGEVEKVDGVPVALIGVFQDITDRHALETSLRRSADSDSLTGIGNRAAFDRALRTAMADARVDGRPLVLMLADLDAFKSINDTFGHAAGDDVLRAVAVALSAPWLRGSFAARIGGDEFALIVRDADLAADVAGLSERLGDALRIHIRVDGIPLACGGTVGAAAFDLTHATVRDFMRRVDTVLYAAKRTRIADRRGAERYRAA